MDRQDSSLIEDALARRAASGENSEQLAAAIASTWREIDAGLSPVLGKGGVGALYKRSLFIAARTHPWLAIPRGALVLVDADALHSLLSARSAEEAAAGGTAVLLAFHDLLLRLVGPSLTARLLRTVWTPLTSGNAAQDKDAPP